MLRPLESGGGGTAGRIGNGVGRACVGAGRCWRRSLCWGACLGAGRCRNRVGVGLVAESVPVGAGVGWAKKGCELLGGLLGASWWPPASWWRPGGLLVASCLLRPPPQMCVKNRSFSTVHMQRSSNCIVQCNATQDQSALQGTRQRSQGQRMMDKLPNNFQLIPIATVRLRRFNCNGYGFQKHWVGE